MGDPQNDPPMAGFFHGKSQKMNEIRIDLGVAPFQETSMSNSARWQDQRSTSLISNIWDLPPSKVKSLTDPPDLLYEINPNTKHAPNETLM